MTVQIFEKMKSACVVSHRMYKDHLHRLGFDVLGVSAVRYVSDEGFKEVTFAYSYDDLDADRVQHLTEGENPALGHIDCVTAVSFVIRLPSGQYVLSGMIDLYKVFPAAGMAFTTSPANAFRECVAKMLQKWDVVE